MKNVSLSSKLLCFTILSFIQVSLFAQSPGGVSTGTVRGWKVEHFDGNHGTNFNAFGFGGTITTPTTWGYTGYITGDEFLGYDPDYFGLQYSGTLEVPQTGSYTFNVYNIDDHATLYIDGVQRAIYTWSGSLGNITATINLTAGDHTILLKYIELGGEETVNIRWSGPGLTANSELDGRFVRVDNAQLAGWYKGSGISFTPNYSGTTGRVNSIANDAPAFGGNGNMSYRPTDNSWGQYDPARHNFNPGANFDGDDGYITAATQNGLAYRSAPRTVFLITNYASNLTSTQWMWGQSAGSGTGTNGTGIYKVNGTQTSMARNGGTDPAAVSTYYANEPKLLSGYYSLGIGNSASINNSKNISANGGANVTLGFTERITNYNVGCCALEWGNTLGSYVNGAGMPELIYYPFELSINQQQRVNTYLAIKYGISLQHNYLNTSGTVLWNTTTNATYNNRVFGIGREMVAEGLNQKQSQSQMRGASGGNDFLLLSKGAITTSNAANTGVLADGDYMILGDNNGSFTPQSTGIPASFTAAGGCAAARLPRQWKVQTAGNPGAITLRAGSAGTFRFPASIAGISILIDTDGDNDFTTGTVNSYPASVNEAGVVTFNNLTIPNGAVITFAWSATFPGGVSTNLALWLKADGELYTDVAGTTAATNGNTVALWRDGSALGNNVSQATAANRPVFRNNEANLVNYNPVLQFTMASSYLQTSSISTALNGNVTGFSAHRFAGNTSDWNALMGSRRGSPQNGWNIYVSNSSGLYSLWTATGTMWTTNDGTVANTLPDMISFSAALGSGSKFLYQKGLQTATGTAGYASNTTNQFQVGSNGDAGYQFGGTIYEQIVYSSVLSNTDRRKVESYLAIKYGTPIDQSAAQDYTNSEGTVIWNGTTNTLYKNNVFGIGRDDCSGLMQKQSKSSAAGDHITISLGAVATTNIANTGSFSANRQFLLIGNNGASLSTINTGIPTAFAAASCNARRYARSWKVQNSNGVAGVTIAIGNTDNKIKTSMTNLQLAVDTDGDGNFTTGTQTLYTATNIKNGVATFDNVILPNNAVFTVCWTAAAPGGVSAPTSGTTAIAGVPHINGLTYKLYAGTASNYPLPYNIDTSAVLPGTLVSSGFLSNLSSVHSLISTFSQSTFVGMEITGKIYIPSNSSTYRFQSDVDDHFSLRINGTTVLNINNNTTQNTTDINLTQGYHDIMIRFGNSAGGIRWNMFWNNGSGSTYSNIPDANLFTTFSGPSVWYAADDIQLQNNANGTNLGALSGTMWPDMSVNANDLTIANSGGNPIYYNTNATYLRNYNPSVYFSEDYLSSADRVHGLALGGLGKTMFGVAQNSANGIARFYSSIGYATSGTNYHQFGIIKRSTNALSLFTYANDINESTPYFYNSSNVTTDIISGTLTTGRVATVYANGATRVSATLANAFSTWLTNSRMINMGGSFSETSTYTGNMNEIIHYPWSLSTTEQQKVNSYLAVKWGITLNQNTPTNYLSADGTVTWTGDASFKYDITGIGRDDCSALNQLQSTSTDDSDIVTISKGALAVNNYVNTASFSSDKQFVIFAHDNGPIATLNTTNMPTALTTFSTCYSKLGRVWKVQTTNSPGSVQLQMGKSGLFLFNKSYYKPKLIISSSSTNWTSASIVDADSVANGLVYFSNVTFTSGQYFTVAIIQAAPGGVASNLNLWLAADDGTSTKTDNTALTSWSDLSLQNMNATGVNGPLYRSGSSVAASNFNPTVGFNGSSQRFTLPTGFANFTAGVSLLSVTNAGATGDWNRVMHLGTNATENNNGIVFTKQSTSNNAGIEIFPASGGALGTLYTTVSNPLAAGAFNIIDWNIAAGSSGQTGRQGSIGLNGETIASTTSLATPLNTSRNINTIGGRSADLLFIGYIPEIILYNRQISAVEKQQIQTYLAVKYGRTLSSTISAYTNSTGSTIYNYSTHWNRITAIGRDDCQALEQKQSKSAEAGGLVTIGIGSTIANANETNANNFEVDKSFAVFGDNGKAATWTGVDNFGNALVRLNRIWRMKETGTIGTVYIEVPGNSSALTTKLPASNTATDPVYLVISNSGNFKAGVTMIEMMPDIIGAATKWYTTYDFADGDYFTFATKKLCLGPAGITDGLTTWYRTDNKTIGVIGTSGTLADETGSHLLTRNGTGVSTVIAGTASSFNYNRSITLSGSAAFTKTGLTNADVTSINAGSMFAVGTVNSSLFRIGVVNTDATGVSINAAFGTANIAIGSGVSGKPNVFSMVAGSGTLLGTVNGTSVSSSVTLTRPTGTHVLGLGKNGGDNSFNNGTVGEAFSFNRGATTSEQQVLNSYLAIKYGQTITHNYYTPDYDGTNAASSTIYDISGYANRIFGIGVDSTGCLNQKQSTSQLDGAMLKIGIGNSIAADNITNTATFGLDRTYVAAGDDNGVIDTWATGTVPAIYSGGAGNCNPPLRIARQWKFKAINNQQTVLITIPDNSSTAATRLPALPGGSTKLYMVVNGNTDMSVNINEEELLMTLNATTKEWEVVYTFPNDTYKYITFVTKADLQGLQPVAISTGTQDATSADCNGTPYVYYKGTTNSSNAIIAVNPNNNTWSPTSITVNNQGTLTGGGGTFSNTGTGYYQSTDGLNTLRITKRLNTIVAPGSYDFNDGVTVRVYYANADTISMLANALPGGGTIQRKGWFKHSGNAAATVAAMTPTNIGAEEITPVAWGVEQGVKYVEFLVNSFSTFGYFAKTTSAALPVELEYFKGNIITCENTLTWKSSVELNFSHYELQYSSDGQSFTRAGVILPQGPEQPYQFKHPSDFSTTWYRLKMVDKDGTSKYSSPVKLVNNCIASSILIFPNPVKDVISVSGVKPGSAIQIRDVHGRILVSHKSQQLREKIQISHLRQGIYFIEVVDGGNIQSTFKIIKE